MDSESRETVSDIFEIGSLKLLPGWASNYHLPDSASGVARITDM
jgi:hypothetical protein